MVREDSSVPVGRLQDAVRRLAEETRGRQLTGRTHQDADDEAGTVLTDDAVGDCCTLALPWGDLIQMRRAAGRVKDLRRADELEALS
jgi:hypothetical protein